MLNSYDLSDRRLIAVVREIRLLDQNRYKIVKLGEPFQRGWRRYYTLSEKALDRQDRPTLEAILEVIGGTVVHHGRDFRERRGRSKTLFEIEQPLRSIPSHEWQRKNYPDIWHRYFRYDLLIEGKAQWKPYWVFTQPSLYRLKIARNWIHEVRQIDPGIERRLRELERWIESRQGWRRYGWLKGCRGPRYYDDGQSYKQRFFKKEHRREMRAEMIFPEIDPAASVRRIPISFRRSLFPDLKIRQRSIRLLTGRAGRTSLRVHHLSSENKHRRRITPIPNRF